MAHCIDATMGSSVVGKLIVYDADDRAGIQAEVYLDGGDHWDIYEPTRKEAAALIRSWRRLGLVLERS